MEIIKRKINGFDCTAVISDSVVDGLHQLQDNELYDGYIQLLTKLIRFLTTEYERDEASEILSCISSLSIYGEIIKKLSVPENCHP